MDVDGEIWAGTDKGLSRLLNKGNTWTNFTNFQGPGITYVKAIHVKDKTVWIGTNGGGVSKSEDGVDWVPIPSKTA